MCRCWLGHNAALLTRPNCFRIKIVRVKSKGQIALADFVSGKIVRVKSVSQNCPGRFPKGQKPGRGRISGKKRNPKLPNGIGATLRDASRRHRQRHRQAWAQGWARAGPERPQRERAAARAASPKKKPPPLGEGLGSLARYFIASASSSSVKGTPQRSRKSSMHSPPPWSSPASNEKLSQWAF